jgi:hypothetical protein
MLKRSALMLAGVLLLAGIAIAVWSLFQFTSGKGDLDQLGSFLGGTVGPLWSAAGLVLVFVAYLAQRDQLALQQQDLRAQSRQLEIQESEIRSAALEQLSRRAQEHFFQMLQAYRFAIESLDGSKWRSETMYSQKGTWIPVTGRRCIHAFRRSIQGSWDHHKPDVDKKSVSSPLEKTLQAARDGEIADHSAYASSMIALLDVVSLAGRMDIQLAQSFAAIVASQLSDDELVVLFYLGVVDQPRYFRLKVCAEEHSLFRHLDIAELLDPEHRSLYAERAFSVPRSNEGYV